MPDRLRLPRIEMKPKEVHILESWRDTVGLSNRPDLQDVIFAIRESIEAGKPLPKGSYRASDHILDELLNEDGVMHLHLGHAGTRELLYAMQYPSYVLFLEISDHYHFTTRPKGHLLKRFHGRGINRIYKKLQLEKKLKSKQLSLAIKAGFKPRSK